MYNFTSPRTINRRLLALARFCVANSLTLERFSDFRYLASHASGASYCFDLRYDNPRLPLFCRAPRLVCFFVRGGFFFCSRRTGEVLLAVRL